MKGNRHKTFSKLKTIVFAILWLGLFFELLFDPAIRQSLFHFLADHPLLAPFVFLLAQALFASFALPCSPLTALAGVLWGMEVGMLYSTLATFFASIWTFVLGRYVLRDWLLGRMHSDVIQLIDRHGWKASMIAHANPVFPGSSLGYAFGISSVSMKSYGFGALMGTLPLQIMMVGIGDSARRILSENFSIWLLVLTIVAVFALIIYKWLVPIYLNKL